MRGESERKQEKLSNKGRKEGRLIHQNLLLLLLVERTKSQAVDICKQRVDYDDDDARAAANSTTPRGLFIYQKN